MLLHTAPVRLSGPAFHRRSADYLPWISVHARRYPCICKAASVQLRESNLKGGDGVDLAISWKAGQEPESPLARAQGSIRAALWISQVGLLHWPQRAETKDARVLAPRDTPGPTLGLPQSPHSSFEPKLYTSNHLVRLKANLIRYVFCYIQTILDCFLPRQTFFTALLGCAD